MVEISQPDANSSFATGAERSETLNALQDISVQQARVKDPWSVEQGVSAHIANLPATRN